MTGYVAAFLGGFLVAVVVCAVLERRNARRHRDAVRAARSEVDGLLAEAQRLCHEELNPVSDTAHRRNVAVGLLFAIQTHRTTTQEKEPR